MDNLISEKCSRVVRNFLCFLGMIVLEFGRTWSCVVQASLDLVVKSRMASNFWIPAAGILSKCHNARLLCMVLEIESSM